MKKLFLLFMVTIMILTTACSNDTATIEPDIETDPTKIILSEETLKDLEDIIGEDIRISRMKNSCPPTFPNTSYDTAFNNFFIDYEWSCYEEDGDTYIDFTGICLLDDEDADFILTWLIERDAIPIRMIVGDESLTEEAAYRLLD